jgi:hypothetical protein
MYRDLVEQTTTTVGTASYAMAGTPPGRRSFASAYTAGDAGIPYVCVDDAGGYETGLGKWNAGVLERSWVSGSSNAGAPVSWAAGIRRIYVDTHSLLLASPFRHNLDFATNLAEPDSTKDAAAGYGTGSTYMATINGVISLFYCEQAAIGTANWSQIPLVGNVGTDALRVGTVVALAGPYNYPRRGVSASGSDIGFADGYYADAYAAFPLSCKTTNATPTKLTVGGVAYGSGYGIYVDGCAMYEGLVTAFSLDRTNHRAWKVQLVAMADGSGTVTINVASITSVYNTAGAAAWSLAAVVAGSFEIALEGTGAAATNIAWSAELHGISPGTP